MNVAIVGCGGIGREYHAPAWSKVEGIRIVAACDVDFAKAEQLAAAYPGCKPYKSVPEMLDKQRDLDACDVTTTERHRAEPLIQCLTAGKHCFCEKPLAGRNGQYDVR